MGLGEGKELSTLPSLEIPEWEKFLHTITQVKMALKSNVISTRVSETEDFKFHCKI